MARNGMVVAGIFYAKACGISDNPAPTQTNVGIQLVLPDSMSRAAWHEVVQARVIDVTPAPEPLPLPPPPAEPEPVPEAAPSRHAIERAYMLELQGRPA
jgi:hypothetical protein